MAIGDIPNYKKTGNTTIPEGFSARTGALTGQAREDYLSSRSNPKQAGSQRARKSERKTGEQAEPQRANYLTNAYNQLPDWWRSISDPFGIGRSALGALDSTGNFIEDTFVRPAQSIDRSIRSNYDPQTPIPTGEQDVVVKATPLGDRDLMELKNRWLAAGGSAQDFDIAIANPNYSGDIDASVALGLVQNLENRATQLGSLESDQSRIVGDLQAGEDRYRSLASSPMKLRSDAEYSELIREGERAANFSFDDSQRQAQELNARRSGGAFTGREIDRTAANTLARASQLGGLYSNAAGDARSRATDYETRRLGAVDEFGRQRRGIMSGYEYDPSRAYEYGMGIRSGIQGAQQQAGANAVNTGLGLLGMGQNALNSGVNNLGSAFQIVRPNR